MKIFVVFAVIFAIVASLAQAQNYHQLFAGFGPYLQQSSGTRDPRSNTAISTLEHAITAPGATTMKAVSAISPLQGPVVFPPSPTSDPGETSGVIVGASGYGFVPPNAAFFAYWY